MCTFSGGGASVVFSDTDCDYGMSKELAKHHRAEGNRGGVLDLVKGLTAYVRVRDTLPGGGRGFLLV